MADRHPRRSRLTALLLGAASSVLVAGGLFLAVEDPPDTAVGPAEVTEQVTEQPPRAVIPVQRPARSPDAATSRRARGVRPDLVVVPALGVRAPVAPIRTVDGTLTPPADPQQVGWWSDGARPGAGQGAAVVTGHTVHTGGGAFDDLETLRAGDHVLVRSEAESLGYVVESVEVLGRAELARRNTAIFGRTGAPRLVLITCEDWDGTGYRSNVVVTARPRA